MTPASFLLIMLFCTLFVWAVVDWSAVDLAWRM